MVQCLNLEKTKAVGSGAREIAMKLPELQDSQRYTGLYIVDFKDHCGVGFRAEEVAELLESEQFQDIHVYKIHNAYPDGRLELRGIDNKLFQMEAGLLFYAQDEPTARRDYHKLAETAEQDGPPCRAVIHLARLRPDLYVTALIYPAEQDDSVSRWLLDRAYFTDGPAEGGTGAVERYNQSNPQILDKKQLFNRDTVVLTGQNLVAAAGRAVIR